MAMLFFCLQRGPERPVFGRGRILHAISQWGASIDLPRWPSSHITAFESRTGTAAIVAVVLVAWLSSASAADVVSGLARVIDGETIAIGSQHIRLKGIDAPETDQVCLNAKGERWTCGIAARDRLSTHVAGRNTSCVAHGEDRYGRTLAICSTADENLNAWMVREGLALAYVKYSREYVGDEAAARELRKGMWAGAFIAPWDWRHRDSRTSILGALSVPSTAQAQLSNPVSSTTAPTPECIIKGNVNTHGERIYHAPGQTAYSKINMQDPRKRWFCSEEDARTAGWRPAKH
jgi:endonuclease YncB( thermonuclease family)